MKILILIILTIFLIPTYNIGGVPIRLEDILFIGVILFLPKLNFRHTRPFIILLVAIIAANFITFAIQLFSGYNAVLQDFNTIFSLCRNILIFYAGMKLGEQINLKTDSIFIALSIGCIISSIVSLIQFYDFGGYGTPLYLFFGDVSGIEYGIQRTVGVVGNPNYAAFFQLCALIAILSIKKTNNKIYLLIKILLSALVIWSVYITFSRTGLLAMVLIGILYLFLNKHYSVALIIAFLVVLIAPFFGDLIQGTRYETLLGSNNSEMLTLNGRVDYIWAKKLAAFYDNPVWGISASKGLRSTTAFDITIFDNSFLYLLVTSGLIGTVLSIAFNAKIITYFKSKNNNKIFLFIALLHINMFVFYLTTDLVKVVMFTSYYFMTMGLLLTFLNNKDYYDPTTSDGSNIKLEQSRGNTKSN